ncbi:MAG: sigma-70 family RNA polymerase sigma factor [Phycisphaeraceae bacterium]|nr:sigma-70 family RNA polymerase sigma factor [Phycisphaeraceae bacterium]
MPPADPRPDLDLIAASNRRDDQSHGAFEALYVRHRDFVWRLALRFTQDQDLAADVLQNTFAYLAGKFPGFTLTCRLTTFLYPVVRHESLAALRARRRAGGGSAAGSGPGDDDLLADLAGPSCSPADPRGPGDDLRRILAVLPAPQREVVLMRFVDDLSMEQIAQALDIPVGTVKSRLHHAIATLRADPAARRYFLDS